MPDFNGMSTKSRFRRCYHCLIVFKLENLQIGINRVDRSEFYDPVFLQRLSPEFHVRTSANAKRVRSACLPYQSFSELNHVQKFLSVRYRTYNGVYLCHHRQDNGVGG